MADYFLPSTSGNIITTRIEGVKEATEALKQLEFAARRRVVSAAVRAANAVIVKEARHLAPVGKTGQLKKQIRGTVKMDRVSGVVRGEIKSSPTKKQRKPGVRFASKYAHMVIAGTKPHSIQKGAGGPMLQLPTGFYARLWHPGAKPRPFMEQAASTAFQAAVNAFGFKFDEALAKEIEKVKHLGATRQALATIAARF